MYIEFLKKITTNVDDNCSITKIEEMLEKTNKNYKDLCLSFTSYVLDSMDENSLINKKKAEYEAKGIKLLVKCIRSRSLLTTQGEIQYSRRILEPSSKNDKVVLSNCENVNSIIPEDNYFKVDKLPFKISAKFMLEIAHLAVNSNSYKYVQSMIDKIYDLNINHETIRKITNLVGKIVYDYDCDQVNKAINLYKDKQIIFENKIDEILYIEIDGSFVNTRDKDKNNSTWAEIKLCIIFSSKDLKEYRNKDGEVVYKVTKAQYIAFLGNVEEFQKHVLALALRNNYHLYKQIVIISDGATWIKNIKEQFFPNAQQILDIFHLFENTSNFLNNIYNDKSKIEHYRYKWFELLEQGEWKKVLKDLEKFKDKKMPAGVVNLYQYIKNNSNNIDYPTYRLKYYFIGSGAIESGNKNVVQARLKLSGMRWEKINAKYLISLRCKEYSDEWNIVEELFKREFPF